MRRRKVVSTGAPIRRRLAVSASLGGLLACLVSFSGPLATRAAAAPAGWFAYVANWGSNTVTPIDASTNTADTPIGVGHAPSAIALTPDGQTAYVLNTGSSTVTPINTSLNTAGTPILVGQAAFGIAVAPGGEMVYVTSTGSNSVTPIRTSTNTALPPISVGAGSYGIAITPDGKTAYVSAQTLNSVIPINLATAVAGTPIPVGADPTGLAVTPDGTTVFVANDLSNNVTPINTATNSAQSPIALGAPPTNIAITPDGTRAYVTDTSADEVTPINVATRVPGTAIPVTGDAQGIAITPDGATAYVSGFGSIVTPIDIATGVAGTPITAGSATDGIAITPDQPPFARLSVSGSALGIATNFDASFSTVPYGAITSYAWNFGDGRTATTTTPSTSHLYAAIGTYSTSVTETSTGGTATTTVYTGQTMSRNGGPSARASQKVTIVAPSSFTALSPFRVCDTRAIPPANQCTGHTLGPDSSVDVHVTGTVGPLGQTVPADAIAVALNVTALSESSSNSFISVFPAGAPIPPTSNVSFDAGATQANLVVARLAAGGDVSVYNSAGRADVVVDVEGYFAPPGAAPIAGKYHTMPPLRICDSRAGQGTECAGRIDNALPARTWRDVVLSGIPSGFPLNTPSIPTNGAAAAVFNLTAVNATQATYLSVASPSMTTDRCPTQAPAASNLNPRTASALPNRIVSALGPHQDVCVYNAAGSADFIIDVNGWFGDGTESATVPPGALFYSIPPARICDTRPTTNGSLADCENQVIGPKFIMGIQVDGVNLVPPAGGSNPPLALVANLTAVSGTATTFFTLFAGDAPRRPLASDLNPRAGDVVANLDFVSIGTSGLYAGLVGLYNEAGDINAILDDAGWFQ